MRVQSFHIMEHIFNYSSLLFEKQKINFQYPKLVRFIYLQTLFEMIVRRGRLPSTHISKHLGFCANRSCVFQRKERYNVSG